MLEQTEEREGWGRIDARKERDTFMFGLCKEEGNTEGACV